MPNSGRTPDQFADCVDDVAERGGVAGSVGEKDQVGVLGEHLLGAGPAGQQGHPAAALAQLAHDVELDPGVDADDVRAVALEADRLGRGDGLGEVGTVHRGLGGDLFARFVLGRAGREDAAAHRAAIADVADDGAGVDAADPRHAAVGEPVEPAALRGGNVLAVLGIAHDDAAGVDAIGLHRRGGDAVVADQRVGEDDDLPRVRGIRHRLLVPGHPSVEDHLPGNRTPSGTSQPIEPSPVLEKEEAIRRTHSGAPFVVIGGIKRTGTGSLGYSQ